jgi:hypothetical protein
MRKVIDAFLYNGEEDILDLRIEVLKSVVDEFWIIESDRTFTGRHKKLVYEDQSSFRNWPISKIRYFPYLPILEEISKDPWENEFAQRNYLSELVCYCNCDDLILYSDVDEIPAPEAVTLARQCKTSKYFGFEMSTHYLKYNFVMKEPSALAISVCTIAFSKESLELHSPNQLRRGIRDSSVKADILKSGGWHFSYMMNEELIKKKIKSFSHQELNNSQILDGISIKKTLKYKEDLFYRAGYKWDFVSLKNLPNPIRNNPRKYAPFLDLSKSRRLAYWIASVLTPRTNCSSIDESDTVGNVESSRMNDIYLGVERDIHWDSNDNALQANFAAYDHTCWYEDGMFNRNYRDFSANPDFENAYLEAVSSATSSGRDPHIRWRARTFEYFLRKSLPGNCIEIGTAHGFLFYFALRRLQHSKFDFSRTNVTLIDKFDQESVDRLTGERTGKITRQYADSIDAVTKRFTEFPNVQIVQGLVPEILESLDIPDLNFIHIDLNAAQPEIAALKTLFPYLNNGGYVLLDDYGFPETAESRIAHDNLAHQIGYEILALPTGQGLIIK